MLIHFFVTPIISTAPKGLMALPPCGIYKTTRPLPGYAEQVPAGRLIYFHNHSDQGPPLVLLPKNNTHNRWSFQENGFLVQGDDAAEFLATLVVLPAEGLYITQRHVGGEDSGLPPRTLVQVGYNQSAHVIVFGAQPHGNGLVFGDRGTRFEVLQVFDKLSRASFDLPRSAPATPSAEDPPILH